MDIYYKIVIGLLLIIAAVLFVRVIQYKRQMRIFADKLKARLDGGVDQDIHVEYFDRDILRLANALNDYSDQIKEKNLAVEKDRARLKSVIAGISHDFRTPLTAAKGYMQLMKKGGHITGKDQEYLDIALAKTDYLRVISDAFFEVSSAEAKDDEIETADVDVAALLTSQAFEQYDWVKESGVNVTFDIPEQPVIVRSNDTMLSRIFANFFSNARKYARSRISVRLVCEDGRVKVIFENDIDSDNEIDIDTIFDAFCRGKSRQKEGAGLGLYIVRCLADKLGHEVSAEAQEGVFVINISMVAEQNYKE